MKNRRNLKLLIGMAVLLMMTIFAPFVSHGQTTPTSTPSAVSLPSSVTAANDDRLRRACAEAVEELKAARKLIEARGIETQRYEGLLRLERQISEEAKQINSLSEAEKAELRRALMAKDAQVAALEAAIVVLKKQRQTVWKKFKAVSIGVLAGVAVGIVISRQ